MVNVELVSKTTSPHGETIPHGTGESVSVQDGHLYVSREGGTSSETVAIYAPGTWANAVVEE